MYTGLAGAAPQRAHGAQEERGVEAAFYMSLYDVLCYVIVFYYIVLCCRLIV